MTTQLKIQGMSCGHCVGSVKGALEAVAGVTTAEVDLAGGTATVLHDESTTRETLIAAVQEEGYTAEAA